MATYYTHIIQTVQPEGPYDLGGYSMAGRLAYEVTRQLQELGQVVNTIVMLDSAYGEMDLQNVESNPVTQKAKCFSEVNILLLDTIMQKPEKICQTLIHRDEINLDLEDEEFLKQLIMLARSRGLHLTDELLYTHIKENIKIGDAFEVQRFSLLPLPNPQEVTCYYFRNMSRLFLGILEPYFVLTASKYSYDNINYWEEWEKQISRFYMIDVDSSNHMMLLSEPKAYERIISFCKRTLF